MNEAARLRWFVEIGGRVRETRRVGDGAVRARSGGCPGKATRGIQRAAGKATKRAYPQVQAAVHDCSSVVGRESVDVRHSLGTMDGQRVPHADC